MTDDRSFRLCLVGVALAFTLDLGAAAGPAKARPRADLYHDLTARESALAPQWPEFDASLAEINAWLDQHALIAADLPTQLARIARERERKFTVVTTLEANVRGQLDAAQLDPSTLAMVLAGRQAEAAQLATRVAALHADLDILPALSAATDSLQAAVALTGLESRTFLLVGDRIAPFRQPYFTAHSIKVRLADRTIAERLRFSRASDAGTIAAALQPGGELYDWITADDFDPSRVYLNLWVCPDAVAGYRAIIAFLRDHQIRYSWTTDSDEPWVARDGNEALETWGYAAP